MGGGEGRSAIATTPPLTPPSGGGELRIHPSPSVLEISQHRVREKTLAQSLSIGTAPFAAVNSREDLLAATQKIGTPGILKTCTLGYDGKGQWMIRDDGWRITDDEKKYPWLSVIRHPSSEYILEGFVNFTLEISVLVARNAQGEVACYEPVHNIHKNHILDKTIVPAPISEATAREAESIAKKIAEGLNLVGLLAVEMFVVHNETEQGEARSGGGLGPKGPKARERKPMLLVNELAPRPHNSGHWTMDASKTSQFEQVLRAVCGLPLGDPARTHAAVMQNLIGDEVNDAPAWAQKPGAHVHLYGKKDPRPGRKMGHVNVLTYDQ